MKQLKNLLVILIVGLLIVLLTLLYFLSRRFSWNTENLLGNTPGNINNGGSFCEADGKIYFANAADQQTLYVMNSDLTQITKLLDVQVSSLNVAGKYLYYYQTGTGSGNAGLGYLRTTHGVYRSNLKGKHATCLNGNPVSSMLLCGNYLYMENYGDQSKMSLYRAKIDDSELIPFSESWINPAGIQNGILYYNGTGDDHYLYSLDLATGIESLLLQENTWFPIPDGEYVYYLDAGRNYRLSRYSLYNGTTEILTQDRVDAFNIRGNMIYYSYNSLTEPALKRMGTDGSNPEIVAEGVYTDIQMTDRFVFFKPFDSQDLIYYTDIIGPINVRYLQTS